MLVKNCYSWKRKKISSLLEILIPISLVAVLLLIKATNKPDYQKDHTLEQFTFAPNSYLSEVEASYNLCQFYLSKQPSWGYGIVSDNDLADYIKDQISSHPTASKLIPVTFKTQKELDSYIESKNYDKRTKLCFAIQIDELSNDLIEISFRSNSSYVFSEKSPLLGAYMDVYNFYRSETLTEALLESDPNFMYQYLSTGFFQSVNFISNYILKKNGIEKEIVTKAKAMSNTKFKRNSMLIIIKSIMPLIVYIGYLIPMCKMISAVIKEREGRIKELLIVMGISNNVYWSSWIFHYLIIYTIISASIALIIGYGLFLKSSIIWLFFLLWLFGVFCIFYSQLVSVFFTKAKIIIFVTAIFYLLGYVANYGLETESKSIKIFTCFIPIISFHLALNTVSDLEIKHSGFNYDSLTSDVKNFQMINVFIVYPITIVIIALLAVYFENILPSGYKKKRWNFFLKAEYYKKKVFDRTFLDSFAAAEEFVEDVDPAMQIQKKTNQAMIIRGLSKSFGQRRILKDINLDIYEGQIFSLLGHNSSGKTTTINILIGSIQACSGEMTIGNHRLSENIQQIRESIGACLQDNILFSILTPYEHILVFSIFKRIPLKQITTNFINEKLAEVKLLEAKDTIAEKLSGGQKRKLCLAIALLGNSKIVILDEPTSGMDLNSRRYVWDLLKNNKTERIILLTTHYMEEADILSDRVAMLIDGSVKCCGSPLYLKTSFGGGYYLTLLKDHNMASREHTNRVMSFMEYSLNDYFSIIHDMQSEITFQLPFNFIKDSLGFFKELERSMESLALRGYSISVTTLEEVFMKIMQLRSDQRVESTKKLSFDESLVNNELSPLKIVERKYSKCNQLRSVIRKRFISTKRDKKNSFLEMFCPGFMFLLMFGMINWKFLDSFTRKLEFDSSMYSNGLTAYNSYDESDKFMSNFSFQTLPLSNSEFESLLYPNLSSNLYTGVYFDDLDPNSKTVNFTLYPNQLILHSSAFYYTQLTQCTLTNLGSQTKLKVNNFPFPTTFDQKLVASLSSSYVLITGLSIAFAFVPSSLVIFMSNERVTGVKHLHRISGLDISIYWIGNFMCDMLKSLIMAVLSICIIYSLDFTIVKGNSDYQMTSYLILAFSFNAVMTSYMSSFIFSSPNSANVNSLALHLVTGCLLPILLIIVLNFELSRNLMKYFVWIFRIFPNFNLNWGIMKVANSTYITTILSNTDVPYDISWEGCIPELFMLLLEGVLCIIGIAIAEIIEVRPYICSRKPKMSSVIPVVGGFDDDVEHESQIAMNTDPADVVVNIKSLSKMFTGRKETKIAVDDISFNIYKGECFSILGVNGAGKTTTFRILTGTLAPTEGEVYVHGYNVKTQISKVRQSLGYCPQNDVLNDALTARETLEIYSDFRGISKESQKSAVEKILELVGLTEHSDYMCGNYSGGNKRKLCLGIAILGFPELVILDEPTAGMDPESRKKVWKVINELKSNQCSVILTSHSMDEAENVSDRITIMTAGRLRCLGTPTYIKQKFGDNFELQLKLENPNKFEVYDLAQTIQSVDKAKGLDKDAVSSVLKELDCVKYYSLINQRRSGSAVYWTLEKNGIISLEDFLTWLMIEKTGDNLVQFLRDNYDDIKVEEHYLTYFKIKIVNDENISLGGIFHLIEINKKFLKIAGYSLSQTSLDQIFNKFANTTNASGYLPSSPTFQSKVFNFGSTRLSEKN